LLIKTTTLLTKKFGSKIKLDIKGKEFPLDLFLRQVEGNSGNHAPTGIIILSGKDIQKNIFCAKTISTCLDSFFSYINGYPGINKIKFFISLLQKIGIMNPYTTMDVFPTLLYILGIPIPDYTDGKIIKHAFSRKYIQKHPKLSVKNYTFWHKPGKNKIKKNNDYDEDIKNQLKGLGYIE